MLLGMGNLCKLDGCSRPAKSRGWCNTHYERWRRNGDLIQRKAKGQASSFLNEVVLSYRGNACLFWPFSQNHKGYAQVAVNRRMKAVHRLVCEYVNGPAPSSEHQAAHSCGNRNCVAGKHVQWKTWAENEADKIVHGTAIPGRFACSYEARQ